MEITQSHTFAALIRLSTTTYNLLTFNAREISKQKKKKLGKTQSIGRETPLDFSLTLVLFKFPDVQSHGRQDSIDPVFTPVVIVATGWHDQSESSISNT